MADNNEKLSMSKFANRAHFCAAVVEREGYDPDDAFNDGEAARLEGFGANPYRPTEHPICHATWQRAFNGAAK